MVEDNVKRIGGTYRKTLLQEPESIKPPRISNRRLGKYWRNYRKRRMMEDVISVDFEIPNRRRKTCAKCGKTSARKRHTQRHIERRNPWTRTHNESRQGTRKS